MVFTPRTEFVARPGDGPFADRMTVRETRFLRPPKTAHRANPRINLRGPHPIEIWVGGSPYRGLVGKPVLRTEAEHREEKPLRALDRTRLPGRGPSLPHPLLRRVPPPGGDRARQRPAQAQSEGAGGPGRPGARAPGGGLRAPRARRPGGRRRDEGGLARRAGELPRVPRELSRPARGGRPVELPVPERDGNPTADGLRATPCTRLPVTSRPRPTGRRSGATRAPRRARRRRSSGGGPAPSGDRTLEAPPDRVEPVVEAPAARAEGTPPAQAQEGALSRAPGLRRACSRRRARDTDRR